MASQITNLSSKKSEKPVWSAGIILAVIAAVCTTLVALTYSLTEARIAENDRAWLEQSLQPALAGVVYDNNLLESTLEIPLPHELPGNEPALLYRALLENTPVAALFVVSALNGFSGPIKLLIGIDDNGAITAVRVLKHRETPGLGDFIDSSKSDWIDQFEQKSLSAPDRALWALQTDGGKLDQVTGASITSRAVVKAVKETLLYFEANRETVFAMRNSDATDAAE
ncbi:MAG: electron transport complex subunit RsxG [Planctomycetota bacterium]|jgi:electron transport complex protein RnfG